MAMSNAERQAAFRARLENEGGKQIAVFLHQEAYEKLLAWRDAGESTDEVINRLLVESDPGVVA